MMRTLLLSTALLALAGCTSAEAQPVYVPTCGDRLQIIDHLDQKWSEAPVAIGLTASNTVMELFASPAGTWTILVTDIRGKACIVGMGDGFELVRMLVGNPA